MIWLTHIGSTIGNSIPSQQESLEEEGEEIVEEGEGIVEEGEVANSTATTNTSEQVPFFVLKVFE